MACPAQPCSNESFDWSSARIAYRVRSACEQCGPAGIALVLDAQRCCDGARGTYLLQSDDGYTFQPPEAIALPGSEGTLLVGPDSMALYHGTYSEASHVVAESVSAPTCQEPSAALSPM